MHQAYVGYVYGDSCCGQRALYGVGLGGVPIFNVNNNSSTGGGRVVANPSGGLLSKGHPLGATDVAQWFELTDQLLGITGARQVEGVNIALQPNLALASACMVTHYERVRALPGGSMADTPDRLKAARRALRNPVASMAAKSRPNQPARLKT